MKAPVKATRRRPAQAKKRSRVYSSLMYRGRKEVSAAGTRAPDFLSSRLSFPTPVVLRLVSAEASRLSRSNRLKVVTVQEVHAAVALVQQRIGTRAAA
ncbi:histone H2B-like [Solea senegalensis]|uniref:Histone H2B-like n=1 Tax=Solea senegalensis TaxID=28829 RepID=A0AAV6Q3L7_SOLSE|nr:histone H2B-like [Solea senegalensis]